MTDVVIRELSPEEPIIREIPDDEPVKLDQPGFFEETGRQFVSGLRDITQLLASPIQRTVGDVRYSTNKGFEYLSPEETVALKESGKDDFFGFEQSGEPTSIFGSAARFAGQTAAAGPVLGRVASLVKAPQALTPAATRLGRTAQIPVRLAKGTQRIISEAGQTFTRSPVITTAIETGFGGFAGAGGYTASQIFPDSDAAKFTGEIIGGVAPSLMPINLAIRSAGGARNLYNKLAHPFTGVGGRQRAQNRIARAIPEGKGSEVVENLDLPTTVDPVTGEPVLTPVQRTGEIGLLSLERAVIESSEDLTRAADAQIAHANKVIQGSLNELGTVPPSVIETNIISAHKYMDDLLDTRVRIAAQRTEERIADFGPSMTREQSNLIAREEIDKALQAARAQERSFYDLIPETTAVPYSATMSAYNSFVKQLGKAQQVDIPVEARTYLNEESKSFFGKNIPPGFKKEETTIKELRALQSKLRDVARNARAGDKKNLNKARIADDIADAIADDLSNAKAGQEVSDAIKTAVTFSRNLNERFTRGTVGQILGRRVTGEARVPAGLTLEESIGVTGPKAREAMDNIVRVFNSPEAPGNAIVINAAEDYFRGRFLSSAVDNGGLNITNARSFIKKNEEVLGRLPNLRRQINEVIETGETLALTERQRARVLLDDPKVSKATMLIEKGPIETFRQAARLKPDESAREMQLLINRAAKDGTGEAMEGLKSAYVEFLLSGAKGKARDINGLQFLSGYALRDALNDPSIRSMTTRLFSEAEQNRLGIIIRDLVRIEKRRTVHLPVEGVLGDRPSKFIESAAAIVGAAVGRAGGRVAGSGGTVQIPGRVSKIFTDLANAGVKDPASRLIRDAIYDETLFRELLEEPLAEGGTELTQKAYRRLNVWAYNVLAEYGGIYEED